MEIISLGMENTLGPWQGLSFVIHAATGPI